MTGEKGILWGSVASHVLSLTLDRTRFDLHSQNIYDLDLVEGVAETVRGSVQLQLAWWLESVWGLSGPILMLLLWGSWGVVVVVVLRSWSYWCWSWLMMVVMDWGWGWGWSRS